MVNLALQLAETTGNLIGVSDIHADQPCPVTGVTHGLSGLLGPCEVGPIADRHVCAFLG